MQYQISVSYDFFEDSNVRVNQYGNAHAAARFVRQNRVCNSE